MLTTVSCLPLRSRTHTQSVLCTNVGQTLDGSVTRSHKSPVTFLESTRSIDLIVPSHATSHELFLCASNQPRRPVWSSHAHDTAHHTPQGRRGCDTLGTFRDGGAQPAQLPPRGGGDVHPAPTPPHFTQRAFALESRDIMPRFFLEYRNRVLVYMITGCENEMKDT